MLFLRSVVIVKMKFQFVVNQFNRRSVFVMPGVCVQVKRTNVRRLNAVRERVKRKKKKRIETQLQVTVEWE